MPLQQAIERRQVQRTIAVHWGNDRYDAASNLERHGFPLARISTGIKLKNTAVTIYSMGP